MCCTSLSCPVDHELYLLAKCWIPFGIQELSVPKEGGIFSLEPSLPENCSLGSSNFLIECPKHSFECSSLEIRYGIIIQGPFSLGDDHKLASPVIYVYFDHTKVVKSLKLYIPHWMGGDFDDNSGGLAFAYSSHDPPKDDRYLFQPLESTFSSMYASCGEVEIKGHSSLFTVWWMFRNAVRTTSTYYYPSPWITASNSALTVRVAIIYALPIWLKVQQNDLPVVS